MSPRAVNCDTLPGCTVPSSCGRTADHLRRTSNCLGCTSRSSASGRRQLELAARAKGGCGLGVHRRSGGGSAIRCSFWSGYSLAHHRGPAGGTGTSHCVPGSLSVAAGHCFPGDDRIRPDLHGSIGDLRPNCGLVGWSAADHHTLSPDQCGADAPRLLAHALLAQASQSRGYGVVA